MYTQRKYLGLQKGFKAGIGCEAVTAALKTKRFRAKLKAKLELQGDRFFHLTLLNRDYWGGSVMQDHGRIAIRRHGRRKNRDSAHL